MTHAFEGFVYPGGGDPSRGAATFAADVPDSKFKSCFQEAADRIANRAPSLEEKFMKSSASAPSMPWSAKEMLQPTWLDASRGTYVNRAFSAATILKKDAPPAVRKDDFSDERKWYPHPSLRRGEIGMTLPAVLANGVDPQKDVKRTCPFYQADHNRLKRMQKMPEAKPRTPPRSKRWFDEEAWNDPANHAHLKVTQVAPPEAKSSLPPGLLNDRLKDLQLRM